MSAAPRRPGPVPAIVGILGVAVVTALMLVVGVAPAVALTGLGAKGGIGLFQGLPDDLKITTLQQKTEIYAKKGRKDVLLASFFNQDRDVIDWDQVPATVKNAALAAEDPRYYEHGGVDPMSILSALASNVINHSSRGASTITQQYVKNVCIQEAELLPTDAQVQAAYLECTGGVQRKLREARLAIAMEKAYDKDKILLGYLNIAGFGGRIYGIESAAQYYYGKSAEDLSVAQAASLMAIVNNPAYLRIDDPKNLAANKVRRDYVLGKELEYKMIDKAAYDEAIATKITPKITPTTTGCAAAKSAAYFCNYVVNTIVNDPIFGETRTERFNKLQSAGWKIYTTLDLNLQSKAKAAMTAYVPSTSPSGTDMGSAAVSVEVGTGRILSMVQSKRFDESGGKDTKGAGYTATALNWNTDTAYGGSSGFQPGSTYKTFTLIDWLKQKHGLYEQVDGSPRVLPAGALKACGKPAASWDVGNDEANEGGYQSVLSATERSVNGAYASMAEELDLCDIRTSAEDLLVHRADDKQLAVNPSSVLGTNLVSPLTMATAYAGIANKGEVCGSIAIDKIVSGDGDVKVPSADCKRGIDQSVAVATGWALHNVITNGTATADRGATGSAWSFAKTGTTDDALDTWVVGGTTKTVTAVWVGNVGGHGIARKSLRLTYGFPYCNGSGQAALTRHCVWSAIQAANQAAMPGDTSWPDPDQQYLYGQQVAVPDVANQTVADAKKTLQAAGFRVKTGGAVESDTAAGQVVSTDPGAGSQAAAGTLITLTPSSGPAAVAPPVQTGVVPNVVGMGVVDAGTALVGAGYTNIQVSWDPNQPACVVFSQTPGGATSADPASTAVAVAVGGSQEQCQ